LIIAYFLYAARTSFRGKVFNANSRNAASPKFNAAVKRSKEGMTWKLDQKTKATSSKAIAQRTNILLRSWNPNSLMECLMSESLLAKLPSLGVLSEAHELATTEETAGLLPFRR